MRFETYANIVSWTALRLEQVNLGLEVGYRSNGDLEVERVAISRNFLQHQKLEVEKVNSRRKTQEKGLFFVKGDGELDEFGGFSNLAREPQIDVDLMRLGVNSKVTFLLESELHVVFGVSKVDVVVALNVSSSVDSKVSDAVQGAGEDRGSAPSSTSVGFLNASSVVGLYVTSRAQSADVGVVTVVSDVASTERSSRSVCALSVSVTVVGRTLLVRDALSVALVVAEDASVTLGSSVRLLARANGLGGVADASSVLTTVTGERGVSVNGRVWFEVLTVFVLQKLIGNLEFVFVGDLQRIEGYT